MDSVTSPLAKRKQSSRNVEKAVKAQKTSDRQITPEPSSSSGPQENVAVEPDTVLFWVIITNVHEKVASQDIFRALFKRCTHLRSHAFQTDSASQFRGIVEVAFERKKDAEEAVNHFYKNIKLLRKTWKLYNRRHTFSLRSSDPGSSSSTGSVLFDLLPRIHELSDSEQSSDEGLPPRTGPLEVLYKAFVIGTGDSTKVNIAGIDTRVPEEVIVPLMEKAGKLRSHTIFHDLEGKFNGTAEVVYEKMEDAIDAITLFGGNITFFKQSWLLDREQLPPTMPSSSSEPFWIIITNVHKKAASQDIFRALFKQCTHMRSHAFQSDSDSQFRGIVEVGFERKKDAEEAVYHFQNNIKLFGKTWTLYNRRHTFSRQSSDAGSSSSTDFVDMLPVIYGLSANEQSSDEGLPPPTLGQVFSQSFAIGTGDSTKVTITRIDTRVPEEVIVPLMGIAGKLRSHTIFLDSEGKFNGTAEVVYEQKDDAIDAIRLFDDNITFFKKTWVLKRKRLAWDRRH